MSRFDITIGLLASLATIAAIALYGTRESSRMEAASVGYDKRAVETGAAMFNQYCANCHGFNAAGGKCPPLDETSGLHGGDLGAGVACRLEEVGWNKDDSFGYVVSVISSGRTYSTRPLLYAGNREPATAEPGKPTPMPLQAMPAWSQEYGGPLRPDQVRDIAAYVVAFRDALPEDAEEAKELACDPARIKPAASGPSAAGPVAGAGGSATPRVTATGEGTAATPTEGGSNAATGTGPPGASRTTASPTP